MMFKFHLFLLVLEKWNAKIFAVFESFVYQIAPNSAFPLAGHNPIIFA